MARKRRAWRGVMWAAAFGVMVTTIGAVGSRWWDIGYMGRTYFIGWYSGHAGFGMKRGMFLSASGFSTRQMTLPDMVGFPSGDSPPLFGWDYAGRWRVLLPPWALPPSLLAVCVMTWWMGRRQEAGSCGECSYNLAGLPAVRGGVICPECGRVTGAKP